MIFEKILWFEIGVCVSCFGYYIQIVIKESRKSKRRREAGDETFVSTVSYDIERLTKQNVRMENDFVKHAQKTEDLEYAINRTSCELMRIEAKIDIEIKRSKQKTK
jgi:hypothetical protein